MKFLPLIWAGLWRRPVSTVLLFLTVANAFLLFGLLQGFVGGLGRAAESAHADLLFTTSRVSQAETLPVSAAADIGRLDGVRAVSPLVVFRSYFRDRSQLVRAFAFDPTHLTATAPALEASSADLRRFQQTRDGMLVSRELAERYGWTLGERVPLISQVWEKEDGSSAWAFQVVGFYTAGDNVLLKNGAVIRYDYLDEARRNEKGRVNALIVRLGQAAAADRVQQAIDDRFRNSADETRTASESQAALNAVRQIGDVGALSAGVAGAVLIALILSLGASFHHSVRERTAELAILRVIGTSSLGVLALILSEVLFLVGAGAGAGLAIASVVFKPALKIVGFMPIEPGHTWAWGGAAALLLAVVAALPAAARALKLRVVDALAQR